jgi:hypothetical protein
MCSFFCPREAGKASTLGIRVIKSIRKRHAISALFPQVPQVSTRFTGNPYSRMLLLSPP